MASKLKIITFFFTINLFLLYFNIPISTDKLSNSTPVNIRSLRSSSLIPIWYKTCGLTSLIERGNKIAIDSNENIYITGYSGGDIVLLKYDLYGTLMWGKIIDHSNVDKGYSIASDKNDDIYIVGESSNVFTSSSVILIKITSSGDEKWTKFWGGSNRDLSYDIVIDENNDLYITGMSESYGAGNYDVLLMKYNSSGSLKWNITWGGSGYEVGYAMDIDNEGNLYITGYTDSYGAGDLDIILLKFNSSGNLEWNKTWGGSAEDFGKGIALDSLGNIYITGYSESFGKGYSDLVLLKYNSSGELEWNKTIGGIYNDIGEDIDIDNLGYIYISGYINNFNLQNSDIILLKYDSSGNLLINESWDSSADDLSYGISLGNLGNIYITGFTEGCGAINGDILLLKFGLADDSREYENKDNEEENNDDNKNNENLAIQGYNLYCLLASAIFISLILLIRKYKY
ncbi:MAG: SBBP repeat-containing protein [Candidatus Helarchaeota archaeon]